MFACFSMQGQIGQVEDVPKTKVIGVANKMAGLPKLEVRDDLYQLTFTNLEYPALKEIETLSFYGDPEGLDYLYDFLKGQFKTKDMKTITLGDNQILVKKTMGSLRVMVSEHVWFYLSKKQLDRLFVKA